MPPSTGGLADDRFADIGNATEAEIKSETAREQRPFGHD